MRKILIDLLLLFVTVAAVWWVAKYQSCSQEGRSIYKSAPAETVYTSGKADTTVTVKKYQHTIKKKKTTAPPAADTVATESYTAVITLAEIADTLRAEIEIMVKEREVFRVDTVTVVRGYECEYWVAGAVVVILLAVITFY